MWRARWEACTILVKFDYWTVGVGFAARGVGPINSTYYITAWADDRACHRNGGGHAPNGPLYTDHAVVEVAGLVDHEWQLQSFSFGSQGSSHKENWYLLSINRRSQKPQKWLCNVEVQQGIDWSKSSAIFCLTTSGDITPFHLIFKANPE
jgi:hypothetical protein